MLLEKQLLMNGESASGGRSVKRARGTATTSDITTTTWVEMSRYIRIHDVVLHVYTLHGDISILLTKLVLLHSLLVMP